MDDANLPKCNNALCISAFEHQYMIRMLFLYYSERLYSGAQCQRPSIVTHTENKFIWHFWFKSFQFFFLIGIQLEAGAPATYCNSVPRMGCIATTTRLPAYTYYYTRMDKSIDGYALSLLTLCAELVEVVWQKNTFEMWLNATYKILVNYLNINLYVLLILFSHPMRMLSSWRYKVLNLVL